jgi:hypothetical protein
LANAVGYLSGILLKAMEQGELEERIAKLEADLAGNTSAETSTEPDATLTSFPIAQM